MDEKDFESSSDEDMIGDALNNVDENKNDQHHDIDMQDEIEDIDSDQDPELDYPMQMMEPPKANPKVPGLALGGL